MGKEIRTTISRDYQNNSVVKNFVENLPEIFEQEGTVIFSERNIIKRFSLDDSDPILSDLVVKKYKKPRFIQRIIYSFFRKSKAERAFYNAIKLRERDVETPEQIAFVEDWDNDFFEYGYYVTASDYSDSIRGRLIEQEAFDPILADNFACFVAELHKKGILHHDLNSTNVLYRIDKNDNYRFSLIDINRMTFLPETEIPSKKVCLDNLTRFTGRMDLFSVVLKSYAVARGWDMEQTLSEAIFIKNKHDLNWKRRKSILKIFKTKKS